MFSKLALGGIWAYQQYISPNKGFRCAYSVTHGGTGCSGFVKHAITDQGLWRALPAIRQRFRDCRAAYQEMRAKCVCSQQAPLDDDERAELERRRRDDKWYNKCDCCTVGACECGSAPLACMGRGGGKAAASKGCDVNPCDGDIGFGGCDCASCDCGGCSCG